MIKKYILLENYHDCFEKDQIVYRCNKPTYGCCDPDEIPVTFKEDGDYPFIGVPKTLLKEIK